MTSEQVAERDAIDAAHPLESGRHDLYAKAMRLVGERHAKGDLVDLVVWLLMRAEIGEAYEQELTLRRAVLIELLALGHADVTAIIESAVGAGCA